MKRNINKKTVCIIGHFGFAKNLLNGQTVKTKIITKELEKQLGKEEVLKIDTHGGKKKMLQLIFQLPVTMKNVKNIIMMPAHNGIRFFAPLLVFFNSFFHILPPIPIFYSVQLPYKLELLFRKNKYTVF